MLRSYDLAGPTITTCARRALHQDSGRIVIIVLAAVVWTNRYWSEKWVVHKFFAALMSKDYESAYGIYYADPQAHPDKYSRYLLSQFIQDWAQAASGGSSKATK